MSATGASVITVRGTDVGVAVGVIVGVGVIVAVGVTVGVGLKVGVNVAVAVGVRVGVDVGVAVEVGVGVRVGVTVARPLSLLDLAPTMAALLGLDPHPDWHGQVVAELLPEAVRSAGRSADGRSELALVH